MTPIEAAGRAVKDGDLSKLDDAQLDKLVADLATQSLPNPTMQHAAIIQALSFDHFRLARFLERLDNKNTELSQKVARLTTVATVAAIVQAFTSVVANSDCSLSSLRNEVCCALGKEVARKGLAVALPEL